MGCEQRNADLAWARLHYAFDLWVDVWRKKCAQGEVVVVRYADDSAPRRRGEESVR